MLYNFLFFPVTLSACLAGGANVYHDYLWMCFHQSTKVAMAGTVNVRNPRVPASSPLWYFVKDREVSALRRGHVIGVESQLLHRPVQLMHCDQPLLVDA